METRRIVLALALGAFLSSCGVQERSVEGQVFVVTKGRENIKLALVEVSALSQNSPAAIDYFKGKIEVIQGDLVRAKAQMESAVSDSVQAGAVYEQAKKRNDDVYRRAMQGNYRSEAAAFRDFDATAAVALAAIKQKKESESKRNAAQAEFAQRSSDRSKYFEFPSQTIAASAKTDADGRFSMKMPKGPYWIAAKASRSVSDAEETYFWLVSVDTSGADKTIMLSNDNQVETNCNDCYKIGGGK